MREEIDMVEVEHAFKNEWATKSVLDLTIPLQMILVF